VPSHIIVKRNDVGKVRNALQDEVGHALDDLATDLADLYRGTVWKRLGFIAGTVTTRDLSEWAVEIVVGWYGGAGFYSGFQEFGTVKQAARPVVRPGAHQAEPIFASYVESAIKKACAV
jgi:HK97 gp10 family phage protein